MMGKIFASQKGRIRDCNTKDGTLICTSFVKSE